MKNTQWDNSKWVEKLIKESTSLSDACRRVGLNPQSNIRTIKKYIDLYDIDTDHFTPYAGRKGKIRNDRTPIEDILVENSTYHRWHLKRRLISEGIFENKCSECDLGSTWNEKPLTLHLDHINGNSTDNRLENLRLLCPNCHSQTPTYGGRNK